MEVRSFFVIFVILKVVNCQNLAEGEGCTLHDGTQGICQEAHSCDWAKTQLQSKQITHQQLVRCGFEGAKLIICCKDSVTVGEGGFGTSFRRKSDTACDSIKQTIAKFSALNPHVTNGLPTQLGEYPHMVAIGFKDQVTGNIGYNCGGTLISRNFVLSAAHCTNKKTLRPTVVKVGRITLADPGEEDEHDKSYAVKNIIIHPNYTSRKNYDDIAILEIEPIDPADFSKFLLPACLHTDVYGVGPHDKLWVTGWGVTELRKKSEILLKGALSYVTDQDCVERFQNMKDNRLSDGIRPTQV